MDMSDGIREQGLIQELCCGLQGSGSSSGPKGSGMTLLRQGRCNFRESPLYEDLPRGPQIKLGRKRLVVHVWLEGKGSRTQLITSRSLPRSQLSAVHLQSPTLPHAGLLPPPSLGAPCTPRRDTAQTLHRLLVMASVGRVPTGDPWLCAPGVVGRVVPPELVPAPLLLRPRCVRDGGAPRSSQELPNLHHPAVLGGLGLSRPPPRGSPAPAAPVPGTDGRSRCRRGEVGPGAGEGRAAPIPPGRRTGPSAGG